MQRPRTNRDRSHVTDVKNVRSLKETTMYPQVVIFFSWELHSTRTMRFCRQRKRIVQDVPCLMDSQRSPKMFDSLGHVRRNEVDFVERTCKHRRLLGECLQRSGVRGNHKPSASVEQRVRSRTI
jgi:hypothetical protein